VSAATVTAWRYAEQDKRTAELRADIAQLAAARSLPTINAARKKLATHRGVSERVSRDLLAELPVKKRGRTAILKDATRYSITAQKADIEYARIHFVTPSQAFRELIAAHANSHT
jgi:hypothetical protein